MFAKGYVDVLPLRAGQLASQRAYIHNNPRQRLLRSQHALRPERGGIDTALGIEALKGYLKRECPPMQVTADKLQGIEALLLTMPVSTPAATRPVVTCDTYGSRALLSCRLLPVVCHRKDAARLAEQKRRCLDEAAGGAVLVSARISKGEQDIMDAAVSAGHPVVLICDNGFPELFHPSEARTQQCAEGRVLLVTPWQYHYRHSDDKIYVAYCKTMNCLAQALCHTKDSWWQSSTNHSALRPDM